MKTCDVEVLNKLGLHARAAAEVVRTASGFESEITLAFVDHTVSAKGIMGLMMLAAIKGTHLTLCVDGADEDEAYPAIRELFESRFGEEE